MSASINIPSYGPTIISAEGWLSSVKRCMSPNFNQRPLGVEPNLLVIHNISLPPGKFGGGYIEQFFTNSLDATEHRYFEGIHRQKVSANCLISRKGEITQFVSFKDRAWHAGVSSFDGQDNCNDFSIGIELEGTDNILYAQSQYKSLLALTRLLFLNYPLLSAQRIVGHNQIAPDRKTDPGAVFDWGYFLLELSKGKEN